jgi:predicted Zn-dependent protease
MGMIRLFSNRHWMFFLLLLLSCVWSGKALASFTIEDEKKLGREFHEKLKNGNALLLNEQINDYVAQLGERVLAAGDQSPFDFQFSVIRSSAINAFATPGGYVYINQGLINLVENEAQLAGILAHEIAHVKGRHIAEQVERSTKLSISTLAAILAGAFLGGGGDLTAAVATFSTAAATSLSLKYSREQEEAADRMGMAYLVASGYDGKAMLDFLKIMRQYEFYSNAVPSYFLTHPGTDDRIRYLDALLQTKYRSRGADGILGRLKRIQVILLLDAKTPDACLAHLQKELSAKPDDPDILYGLAVTEGKLGRTKESLDHFRKALGLAPDDPDILRDMGILQFNLGQPDDALLNLRRAAGLRDHDFDANLYLGKTLSALNDTSESLLVYNKLESRRPDDPEVLYDLGMLYGKKGRMGDSHYYFGRHFKIKGKTDSALFHFNAALKAFPPGDEKLEVIRKEIDSLSQSRRPEEIPPAPSEGGIHPRKR